ncbi:MAG: outer membrane beta-barrel protein [Chlorobiaceae bacterium]
MKKIAVLYAAIACLWTAPVSAAAPYVSGSVGLGFPVSSNKSNSSVETNNAIEFKTGFPFCGAIGVKSGDVRSELSVGYQKNDIDNVSGAPVSGADASVLSFMANAYYEFYIIDSSVIPYVMGGVGDARVKAHESIHSFDIDKSVFAWQAGAGAGVKSSKQVTLDVGYRYFKTSKVADDYGSKYTISSSNILVGLRYRF